MPRSTSLIALSILTVAVPANAATVAAPLDPAAGFAPRAFAFDDPSGKGVRWERDLPCGANRATVTVKFDKAYFGEKDLPVAKIWLHAGKSGDPSEQYIAAVVKVPTDAYRLNALAWLEKDSGGGNDGPGYVPADLDRPMQINLPWDRDGAVSAEFGGEFVKHITTREPVTSIGLAVSWAKFEFIGLKVGRAGAPDPACAPLALLGHAD